MPLGVHLPGCPCARCEACALIIQRMSAGKKLIPVAAAPEDAGDGSVLDWRRDPWADLRGDD
jgi:hypothetical protein